MTTRTVTTGNSRKGFASMSKEKVREIAALGGRAAHAYGKAHRWTSEEAAKAGRVGGSISKRKPRKEVA